MGTQALVIFLRFASLQTDARPWLAPTEVYRRTGVKLTSQWRIIQRWRSNGFLILRNQRPGQPRMLTAEQAAWVTSPETLQAQSHLSLARRAEQVRERFGFAKFSGQTLMQYYRRLKIRYKWPDYRFWKSLAENRRLMEE